MKVSFFIKVCFCILTYITFFSPIWPMDLSLAEEEEILQRQKIRQRQESFLNRESCRYSPMFSRRFLDSIQTAAAHIADSVASEYDDFLLDPTLKGYKKACRQLILEEELSTEEGILQRSSYKGVKLFLQGHAFLHINKGKAIEFLRGAAEHCVSLSYIFLADCCFSTGKTEEGFEWIGKASLVRQLKRVAFVMAMKEKQLLKDYPAAFTYAKSLSELGDNLGRSYMGILLIINPQSSPEQKHEGWKYLMETSSLISSQIYLGICSEYGIGTRPDTTLARTWYAQVITTEIDSSRYGGLFPSYVEECMYFQGEARKFLGPSFKPS